MKSRLHPTTEEQRFRINKIKKKETYVIIFDFVNILSYLYVLHHAVMTLY